MSEFLKGNFKVQREVKEDEDTRPKPMAEQLRERALANISGSMVFVDDTTLTWDGDQEPRDESG